MTHSKGAAEQRTTRQGRGGATLHLAMQRKATAWQRLAVSAKQRQGRATRGATHTWQRHLDALQCDGLARLRGSWQRHRNASLRGSRQRRCGTRQGWVTAWQLTARHRNGLAKLCGARQRKGMAASSGARALHGSAGQSKGIAEHRNAKAGQGDSRQRQGSAWPGFDGNGSAWRVDAAARRIRAIRRGGSASHSNGRARHLKARPRRSSAGRGSAMAERVPA